MLFLDTNISHADWLKSTCALKILHLWVLMIIMMVMMIMAMMLLFFDVLFCVESRAPKVTASVTWRAGVWGGGFFFDTLLP